LRFFGPIRLVEQVGKGEEAVQLFRGHSLAEDHFGFILSAGYPH
jgi:hypothetical protein